jgi:DNA-binding winged helix-turn-helix (wHTH) protein/Tol biopolymer transport system component
MVVKSFIFRFGEVEAHEREFTVIRAGKTIAVEPKAFRVLLIMLRNPKKLIPKEELLNAVWGDAAVTENSLTRAIALLRRLLGDDAREPRFIQTVTSVGYRWLCPVVTEENPEIDSSVAESIGRSTKSSVPASSNDMKKDGKRLGVWLWSLSAVAIPLFGFGLWYLERPLPTPRIVAYTQITHDGHRKRLAGIDGSRIYFNQWSPSALKQVAITGGESFDLPVSVPGGDFSLLDISADGSKGLLVTHNESNIAGILWEVRLLGGAYNRLGEADSATFSPDGNTIFGSTQQGDVFTIRSDGSGFRKLNIPHSGLLNARYSPDGKSMRYENDGKLWEAPAEGTSPPYLLLPNWEVQGTQQDGKWTSDGNFYVFVVSNSNTGENQIWAIDERHSVLKRREPMPRLLAAGPVHWETLAPSRNAHKIFATGKTLRGELSRIDPKTGQAAPLLNGISAEFVSYSHDGKSIAYVTFPDGLLWKANRDGSSPIQLTVSPSQVLNPLWSPDDKQLVYVERLGGSSTVYVTPVSGGGRHRLIPGDRQSEAEPAWSPDGGTILFAAGDVYDREKQDLRFLDLETGKVTIVPGSTGLWSTRWSEDGRHIAALSWEEPFLRVFDTGKQKWFAPKTNGDVDWPAFSRDSRFIYFLRLGREQGVFRVRAPEGAEERVVDLRGVHLTGMFGTSMSLDPNDYPLVTRDTGTDDIYALTLEEK